MGYGYFFLLGITDDGDPFFKWNKTYVQKIVDDINDLFRNWQIHDLEEVPWFIGDLGKKDFGPAGPFSCGDAKNVISPAMERISGKYPHITFTLYHCYWDCSIMTIYSFKDGEIYLETTHEAGFKHGGITVSNTFSFKNITIPGNITCFFNNDYSNECDLF